MFDNVKLNGDWLEMQALVHELNRMYLNKPVFGAPPGQMNKRGSIPFATTSDFLQPMTSGYDQLTFY